jgi:adenine-specific DNA-methyltransferase
MEKPMSQNLQKLQSLLAELFQLDQAELDFGIYRIMNARRDEITRFLDNDLLPQVREVLSAYESESRATLQAELEKVKEQAKALGFDDPAQAPKVKELQARYNAAFDIEAAESEVFSHLYNFFRRYYSDGDFISQRRYKEGVYAIPYEGEEVKLYWANHDQYYIKTSEYLRNYTFRLPSGKRVHFKLVEADTEKDNNRLTNGNERRFILSAEQPLAEENGELVIRFEYRPDPEKRKQADLNAIAVEQIRSLITSSPSLQVTWSPLLDTRPTEKNPNRTLLEKHLTDYTARNTFDYFIHKDLGGFLRRELDFYIKNEVMHLDDIESETAPRVEQYLAKIKAMRRIAHKIIDFLAQLENFQKKLWLKKKFVVETQYCITLDRIFAIEDEETRDWLIARIIANDAQREEWVRLYGDIETWGQGDGATGSLPFTLSSSLHVSLSPNLQVPRSLMVDTRHFDEAFKLRLLAAIPDIEEETDGLLIHGENFQALNLLLERYKGKVKCIYADPPFNTSETGFIYKNEYRHSSWCAMLAQCIASARCLLCDNAVLATAIDDFEMHHLGLVSDELLSKEARLGTLVVEMKPSGRTNDNFLATSHEYYLLYSPNPRAAEITFFELTEEQRQQYAMEDEHGAFKWRDFLRTGGYSTPEERPNSYYPIYFDPKTGQISLEERPGWEVIWPIDSEGRNRVWRKTPASFLQHLADGEIQIVAKRGGGFKVQIIDRIKAGIRPKSVWVGERYDASSHGTKLLKALFGETGTFTFPKSLYATRDVVYIVAGNEEDAVILDFFAGSGTTGHAVINLNREDGGRRKFILVEMGEYFDTVLVPRLKKVIFTPEWKAGKPKRMATKEEVERSPRILKILRLESYEDTLNNLELKRTEVQQSLLDQHPAFREDYMLHYMLDVESRGSASLLNIDLFEDPFSYKLDIATGTAGETKPTVVDLVETFNYLIGLRVKTIDQINGVRVVTGTNPHGERVLILWRTTKELDNDKLDEWFKKQGYNTRDQEYDVIYVNGDNNLENLRKPDQTWKVRLIEEEFKRLMFAAQDV